MQADSFKKKYTDSRETIDKIRGNLSASGEGEGSYSGCEVQNFLNSDHDAYIFFDSPRRTLSGTFFVNLA